MSQPSEYTPKVPRARIKGRARRATVLFALVGTLLGVALGAGTALLPRQGRIAPGVVVMHPQPGQAPVAIGGLTRSAAAARITRVQDAAIGMQTSLVAGRHSRDVTLAELGVRADVKDTLQAAYAVGRDGTLPGRVLGAAHARWQGLALPAHYRLDPRQAEDVLTDYAREINRPAVDASAHWDDAAGRLAITPERAGEKLDIPASVKLVKALPAQLSAHRFPQTIELPFRTKLPRVTEAMLAPVDTVLATFSTSFASSTSNRATNVETAARSINGTVLLPGDVFSFNKVVGPRDASSGFRTAPVIVNGQLKPGMGGGICQVSSTLYNAVLLANLEIVSRNHHSLPVHYVPPGQDATVSYGAIDFKFKNSLQAPVVVETTSTGRRLTVRLLGKGPAPVVRIERSNIMALPGRTITQKDPKLPKGTKRVVEHGSAGRAVTVTRIVGEGAGAKRELISKDRYQGEPTIVAIGTGEPAPVTPPAAPEPPAQ